MRLCLIYVPGLGMVNDPRVGLKLLSRGSCVVLSRKAPLYEILAFRAQGVRDGRERAWVHDLEGADVPRRLRPRSLVRETSINNDCIKVVLVLCGQTCFCELHVFVLSHVRTI